MGRPLGSFLKYIFATVCMLLSISCSTGEASIPKSDSITSSRSENQISATGTPTSTSLPVNVLKFQEAISSQNCISACWAGIQPGTTDHNESVAILQQRYGVQNVEVKPNSVTWISDGVDNSRGGNLVFFDGVVDSVRVWFGRDRLTVEDLLELLDQPESIRVARAFSSEINCAGASLFYSSVGVEAWLSPEGLFVGANPSQFIDSIMFLSPRLLKNWQITDSVLIEWGGYRDYCLDVLPKSK